MLPWFIPAGAHDCLLTCRPAKDSPYLQIGLSENDTDNDMGQLDTELTVTDTQAERAQAAVGMSSQATSNRAAHFDTNGSGQTAGQPQLPVSSLPVSTMPGIGPQPPTFTSRVGRGGYATLAPDAQSAGQAKAGPQFTLDDDDEFR